MHLVSFLAFEGDGTGMGRMVGGGEGENGGENQSISLFIVQGHQRYTFLPPGGFERESQNNDEFEFSVLTFQLGLKSCTLSSVVLFAD